MNPRIDWQRNRIGIVLSFLFSATVTLIVWDFEFSLSKSLKHLSFDQPYLTPSIFTPFVPRPETVPNDVVLVYLDDRSHQDLGQPYNAPWDRNHHTELVKRLSAEGARAVVFDIVFADPSPRNPEIDQTFATAIAENGKVILAIDLIKNELGGKESSQLSEPILPYELFDEVCSDIGYSALQFDPDFQVRRHLHQSGKGELISSLTWSTAQFLGLELTNDENNRVHPRWVNYYGPPRSLPWFSFSEVVGDHARSEPLFKDKIVYIGAHLKTYNSGERKDELRHPWSTWGLSGEHWKFIAGAEVHATILLNLLRGDWLNEIPKKTQLIYFLLTSFFLGSGLVLLRPVAATLSAIGAALIVFWVAHYLHWAHRLWFPWAITLAIQIPLAWGFSVLFNSLKLYVQKQLLEQSIRAYLSPKLVKAFASRPDENFLKPGAEKQELSILFSDIEGFTSLSEGMDSSKLADLMNGYFETTVSNGIHATDGTVVKYIGDAIFAFWNAPEPQSDHATRACQAAIQIQRQPYRFSESKPVHTRVGIHTGSADVGNFGSANRVDYTAIGENINLASRLEGLNKYLGTRILISRETRTAAAPHIQTRALGRFRLKGFERTVEVLEVLDTTHDETSIPQSCLEHFNSGLQAFHGRDFEGAIRAFKQSQAERASGDGPSAFYLRQLESLDPATLSDDWQGEVTLEEK